MNTSLYGTHTIYTTREKQTNEQFMNVQIDNETERKRWMSGIFWYMWRC